MSVPVIVIISDVPLGMIWLFNWVTSLISIPERNATGKILKPKLRQLAKDEWARRKHSTVEPKL
jgi:hypothetical protein